MKHLKLAVIALFVFAFVGNVSAQDDNNLWVVGFGGNIVDFNGAGSDIGNLVKDFGGTSDFNFLPSVSRISVDRYLEKGFSLQLAGTINTIETVNSLNDTDELYHAIDLNVKYDLNNLVGDTSQWFDPYVYLGGGYTTFGDLSKGMLNFGGGFNTWFNDNLGLNFQTGIKDDLSNEIQSHFQHSVGLVFKFGGTDTDGDGIYDKNDACPEEAGLAEFNGCPDADNDGIKDSDDACPNVAGLAELNGCPDADGDGIADKDDMCVNEKGTKENKGCPDTDGDGVVDKDDKCPTTAGPVANAGCPWPDTDGDGILDKDDKCPAVAGVASEGGCPEIISNEARMGLDSFAKTILFKLDSDSFVSGMSKNLDEMVAIMNEFPQAEFAVKGYTDSTGSVAGNLKLSEKRADAVKDYFVNNGVDASRLTAKGYGEENPIDTNKTRAGRKNNRRVEVKVTN